MICAGPVALGAPPSARSLAWRIVTITFALLVLYQLWLFAHICWWIKFDPASSAFMEDRLEVMQDKNPKAGLKHKWVPYKKISNNLKRALIVSEDARFVDHEGFDWEGIAKAYEKNMKKGKIVAGGSTISQQLAKNLFLSTKRTPWRKGEEALITLMLEGVMDKQRIFEIYLNVIEWGNGVFGAEAAAQHYFGVSAAEPGVGSAREIAAVEVEGHLFLAPDNGLLAAVAEAGKDVSTRRVSAELLARIGIKAPSATFHGRDIFAPLAAELAAGRLQPSDLGPPVAELVPGWIEAPQVRAGQVIGTVVTIDHFGNLITNIEPRHLLALGHPVVRVGGREFALRRTYSDVRPGDYLALVNSFGVVEIARAERSAAEGLGLARGAPVTVVSR